MKSKARKAQNVAEFAVLIALVITAYAGMQLYVKRAIQAKTRDASEMSRVSGENIGITIAGNSKYTPMTLGQATPDHYEPYYVDNQVGSVSENVKRERLVNGNVEQEIVSEVSGLTPGSVRAERAGRQVQTEADSQWIRQ